MKRIIIGLMSACLLILSLTACSNKKTPPDAGGEATKNTTVYAMEMARRRALAVTVPRYGGDSEKYQFDDDSREYQFGTVFDEYHALARSKDRSEEREIVSMIPTFFLDISASSELPGYPVENLLGHSWRSWAEGAAGNGIGESFTLTKNRYFQDYYRGTSTKTVAGFALKNGYGDLNYYSQNNRVKSFKIYVNGKYTETIPVKDSIGFEQYIFEKPVVFKELRFVIDDVYPGTRFNDTCVAEIGIILQPANEEQFYENILYSFDPWEDSPYFYYDFNHGYYDDNYNVIMPIASVSDPDRLLLLDYLPFDSFYYNHDYQRILPRRTRVALLGGESSLRLSGDAGGNLPRLDGATAMFPLYSSFVRAVYPEIDINMEEGDIIYTYRRALYRWPYHPNLELLLGGSSVRGIGIDDEEEEFGSIVQCNKTSEAFRRLIDGETDIIFCYEPSEAEKAAAAKGKQFSLTPVAYDAFVFIVNEKNSFSNITQQQIRDIYSGRVTNWKSISGVDEPVIAYQRPENSGSQTTLQSIMRGDRLIRTIMDGEYISTGMFGMILKVTSDYHNYNSAIGYTFLFYLTQMAGDSGVKTLAVDGVGPTRQTIQNKTYPFVQTVYAITAGNESENTKKFIEWILSAQGQELVAKTGYTPLR